MGQAEQLAEQEEFRAEVQRICEDGKHRTMHTQRQMCSFLDELRNKALAAKIDKPASHDLVSMEVAGVPTSTELM